MRKCKLWRVVATAESRTLTAQQRRTRRAIVDAAARLMANGRTPSMSQIAAEAEVSRRTIYLYFPTLEQLLVDAALGQASQVVVDAELEALAGDENVEERVARVVAAIQRSALETEQLGRTIMRLGTPPSAGGAAMPTRGYRRVQWLERALEPARARLGDAAWQRLISQLTLVTGWEAAIVLRDVRGLDTRQSVEASVAAARALVAAALAA